jgi:hypothetical protein
MNTRSYTTLARLKARKHIPVSDTSTDAALLNTLREATSVIDSRTRRNFEPVQATCKFDWTDSRCLIFKGFDLLQLTSITDGQQTVIDTSAAAMLGPDTEYGPWYGIELGTSFFTYASRKAKAISVTGDWGFHDDYANAWHSSGDQLGAGINGTVTTLSVTNAAGSDAYGQTPRFSAGMMIQIDNERMYITDTGIAGLLSLVGQPVTGNSFQISIAGTTYTYAIRTTLTAPGDVLIGDDLAQTIANLVAAMKHEPGEGTAYHASTLPVPPAYMDVQRGRAANTVEVGVVSTGSTSTAATLATTGPNLSVSSASLGTTLTVLRNVGGTSPASHSNGATISIYEPPKQVQELCESWAAYLVDLDETTFGKNTKPEDAEKETPVRPPSRFNAALETLRRGSI